MSSSNGNGWKPRRSERLECPSGQVVYVRRPGPEFTLRSGRVARTFTAALSNDEQDTAAASSQEDYGLSVIAKMSDEELAAVTIFAKELVVAMLVSPKLVLNPNPTKDEIGPDDIGDDFWFLFNYGMTSFFNLKVPVGRSEVEVKDLSTFREEPGIQGDGMDGLHVPVTESEREIADQGLVGSAGA